ncbi:MAG: DUF167 domain-containing protein [Alphaproteobacteria bacterium]|nr:DUF167 domain-containing protein [Alphaproteobacteria bacterium]
MTSIRVTPKGVSFLVRLTPKGGRDAVEGWAPGADGVSHLKARVRAVPEDGKANAALVELVAKALGVPRSSVALASGATSRLKRLEIAGDGAALAARLARLGEAP